MNKTLIIVESPAKCNIIEKYLGNNNYKVIASYGHFTKLDNLEQIDFNTFNIKYKIDKLKVLKNLKLNINAYKDVIIATDDDREGEAIAWTICTFCKLDINTTKKIVFQEITKPALQKSLKDIKHININRVKSQQARQILDIYLGFKVSPLLWKYIQHKLSAGRCQTPALRLIYDNKKEIDKLNNETEYSINVNFTEKNINFCLINNIDKNNIHNILEFTKNKSDWIINEKKNKTTEIGCPQILITSTLQQKAYNNFNFSSKQTMKCAQELYENGYITYMRTDSSCYSHDFIEKLKKHILSNYNKDYLLPNIEKLNSNKNKNKSQEAHEGIRVCDLSVKETNLKNPATNRLYKFIYKHTIQCGMSNAVYNENHYFINLDNSNKFKYIDKINIFKGWKILDNIPNSESYELFLDNLYKNKTEIILKSLNAKEKLINNLYHYNEATIIKKLENLNIGRPSTYSNILQNLFDKKYIIKTNIEGNKINITNYKIENNKIEKIDLYESLSVEKNKLEITEAGEKVSEFCYNNFNEVFNYDFTNKMEDLLDKISNEEEDQLSILNNYIDKLNNQIKKVKKEYENNPENIKKIKDTSLHCGKYKDNSIFIKNGMYGYYVNYEKNKKLSLKDFTKFNVKKKIDNNEDITQEDYNYLIEFIESNNTNKKILVEISDDCSIRTGKYGEYIYYKTNKMKKPSFFKYNDEKDNLTNDRKKWIDEKNISLIKDYIIKKYKINI
tara:strand:- start:23380 stop:25569 length:2190 start_codon:yes stop_codon:yes gene_type:complete